MRIPLFNRLRSSAHRKVALLQDEVIDVLYSVVPNAVFHGGTAIWRCYVGNRFSEDLDFYLLANEKFKKAFLKELESKGLKVLKYKATANTVFSKISDGNTEIRFEAAFRKKNFVAGTYEKADGTTMNVFVLSAEDLLLEKMDAYSDRRFIRDFYDAFFLSSHELSGEARKSLKNFLQEAKKPVDEKNLKTIVFSGAVPSFEQMRAALQRVV